MLNFLDIALNFICDFLWTMNILFSKTLRVTKSLDIFYLTNKLTDQNIYSTIINYFWKQLWWNYCSQSLYCNQSSFSFDATYLALQNAHIWSTSNSTCKFLWPQTSGSSSFWQNWVKKGSSSLATWKKSIKQILSSLKLLVTLWIERVSGILGEFSILSGYVSSSFIACKLKICRLWFCLHTPQNLLHSLTSIC